MTIFLVLVGFMLLAAMVGGIVWTFRLANSLPSPWWTRAVTGTSIVGAVTGLICGFSIRWQPSEDIEYVGFPIPGMLLHREEGRWVDYISPFIVVSPFLDALIVTTLFLLPLFIAMKVRKTEHRPTDDRSS